jgi:hypothetical protein
METQQKHNKIQLTSRVKSTMTKIELTGFSLPHSYFNEHFAGLWETAKTWAIKPTTEEQYRRNSVHLQHTGSNSKIRWATKT